ncbi:serine hydrolase domain-containing protein [Actinoalloteichus hymeniacidonis]|uniref:Penicillin-binding protein, beta-lactamase class C n=1 Tax=Actinoalloteichus hymeniacidonis TaxID=340345 RepID=A0AAC9HR93_9PSEU|nr:serine hydrolase domain-containing protein [Actinoalloteichus hymeniacidonis]AOS64129.1 penicillin-binding protein, beta-lactamase class C [Actinoalloteichus hymeniacidonis]MBB5907805.1 CubicO group peptidase (beta-lactamase class C family) [Actinoalloteichus hymeniacidonis]
MSPSADGTVVAGYQRVAEAFERSLSDDGTETAQCCVHVDGEMVVDLWSGLPEALEVVFSATKGATAACANLLVQRGLLQLDARVAEYWPAYGVRGKESTLVRWLLSHRAGVLTPREQLTMDALAEWDLVAATLAAQTPAWEPGTAYGYHAQSFGWLVGELVRLVDGRSLGTFFREELAQPAGAEFWIGLPQDQEPRVVPSVADDPALPPGTDPAQLDLSSYFGPHHLDAFTLGGMLPEDIVAAATDRRYRAAEVGASGGVANGRGLSRLYRLLLDEFTSATVEDILTPETEGTDLVLSSPAVTVTQLFGRGFDVSPPVGAPPGTRTFGHGGSGGISAFADPDRRLSFGYTTSRLVPGPPGMDPRTSSLVEAVYETTG